jgi:hypothetical protein
MTDYQFFILVYAVLAWLVDHAWHFLFVVWALFVGFALYAIAIHLAEIKSLLASQINWERDREERYRK